MPSGRLIIDAVPGIGAIRPGDDLISILGDAMDAMEDSLADGDVVVIAQKVVSKAENRFFHLENVTPSARAEELALACDKDPRLVELILSEASSVVRCQPGVLIVNHRLGHTMANAGIDRSNVAGDEDIVLLLPEDPDRWCAEARENWRARFGADLGVVMSDSFGRPWRLGTTGVCIGASGVPALLDVRGRSDLEGRALEVTTIGLGDELAAAASILMGQADEGVPVCVIRGVNKREDGAARDLIRPPEADLFSGGRQN